MTCCGLILILLSLRLWTANDGTCTCGASSTHDAPLWNTDLDESSHGLMDGKRKEVELSAAVK